MCRTSSAAASGTSPGGGAAMAAATTRFDRGQPNEQRGWKNISRRPRRHEPLGAGAPSGGVVEAGVSSLADRTSGRQSIAMSWVSTRFFAAVERVLRGRRALPLPRDPREPPARARPHARPRPRASARQRQRGCAQSPRRPAQNPRRSAQRPRRRSGADGARPLRIVPVSPPTPSAACPARPCATACSVPVFSAPAHAATRHATAAPPRSCAPMARAMTATYRYLCGADAVHVGGARWGAE